MSAVPPIAPESRRAGTTVRVHRMRVARGACWVIVAVLIAGACLALLDAISPLPAWVRGIGLAAWLTGFGVLVWRLVARRLPPDPSTTSRHAETELAGNLRAAAAAALALAASLCAATLVPGAAEHIRRVTLPWSRTGGSLQYRVIVTAGEPVVRRGDPVTLSAYAEKLDPSAATPDAATLVWRDRAGHETALPMSADGTGAFHATRANVTGGFDYKVEIGGSSSDWLAVSVLDPVEPTSRSRIEIAPPAYAPSRGAHVELPFGSITGHQFSTAALHLHFTQPAAAAFLEWRGNDGGGTELIPVALDAERLSCKATFRLQRDGILKLVTVAEGRGKSLRSEFPARVQVIVDAPPRFERLIGLSPRPRTVRPDARIGIEFTAVDDLAVGSAVLEYVVGSSDSKAAAVPVTFSGSSPGRVQGRIDFELSGKVREGERIGFRIRVGDTRQLEHPDLQPQMATYPESGWSVLRVQAGAPPLDEQDIIAQRNALGDALVIALERVKSAQMEIGRIRGDTSKKADLPLEQTVRLTDVREALRGVASALRTAARDASLTPELKPLTGRIGETADRPLRAAEEALKRAATNSPADRDAAIKAAIDSLRAAMADLDIHLKDNQRIAQARLDRKAIAALVREQTAIGDLALPGGTIQPEELARLERELHSRLRKLIADSEPLRTAAEAVREGEARRLALALRELTGFVRDLDAAAKHLETEARKSLLGEAARQQGRVVDRVGQLIAGAESAARLAGHDLPSVKEFSRVKELIEAGRTVDALTELETRAQRIDAVAAAMEKWAADHRDPRLAAGQLAAWQADIRDRFRTATKNNPANFKALTDADKDVFRQEQLALQHFARSLRIPPGVDLRSLHKDLLIQMSIGADHDDPARAEKSMTSAIEILNRIAEAIPTVPDRLAKARTQFNPILVAQEAIFFEVEQALRGNDAARKLPALVERQLRQAQAFEALDIPGGESRMPGIAAAFAAAVKDLRDGAAADALASQQWLKREFDRLRLMLDGMAAPDESAEELARKLGVLARTVQDPSSSIPEKQREAFGAEAIELCKQIISFGIPDEAPALANDARVAALALEAAAREAVQKPAEFQNRLRPAAEATARLAARLNSAESDLDRVRRLSANRWQDWEAARKLQGKPLDPNSSAERRRQLVCQADELVHTRVGLAGQSLKKAVLEQYQRLKEHESPDRQGGPLKTLAQSLDELAALMADVDDLCRPVDRTLPRFPPGGPAAFLPSVDQAASFRELAAQERELRKRIARVGEEVLLLTGPGSSNRIAPLEKDQRDLAAAITALARQFEREKDDGSKLVLEAAIDATLAADALTVGMLGPANGSAERAGEKLRQTAARDEPKSWTKTALELVARLDKVREKMREISESVPFKEIAAQQNARGEELARRAGALGKQLELASRVTGHSELAAAAKELNQVEATLAEATRKGASGLPADGTKLRMEAAGRMAAMAEKLIAGVPRAPAMPDLDPATIKAAEALQRADVAMRGALEVLEPNADRAAAEKAMRLAAEALSTAAGASAEMYSN